MNILNFLPVETLDAADVHDLNDNVKKLTQTILTAVQIDDMDSAFLLWSALGQVLVTGRYFQAADVDQIMFEVTDSWLARNRSQHEAELRAQLPV